jgi:hypothetical protein
MATKKKATAAAVLTLETRTPLAGERFKVLVDSAVFSRTLAQYRERNPLDTREFSEMSSDIQHAIIRRVQAVTEKATAPDQSAAADKQAADLEEDR